MVELLEKIGWTQEFFANRIGVSRKTVSRWIAGKSRGQGYPVAMAYLEMVRKLLGEKE